LGAVGVGRKRLTLRQAEQAFDGISMPDSVPSIAVMMWDAPGNMWVGQRVGGQRDIGHYQVLDREGRWVTTVVLPEGVNQIFEIGEDYVLAQVQDRFDVQYLAVYEIHKPNE
jgi:hypothetical protein